MLKNYLVLSALLLVVTAGKNELDNKSRELEEFKTSKDEVAMKAKAKMGDIEDKLEFKIQARGNDGLETTFKYHLKEKGKDGTNTKFEMRMKVFKIIEFIDNDGGVDGFDENDEVLQEFVIGEKDDKKTGEAWSEDKFVDSNVVEDNVTIRTFTKLTEKGTFQVTGRYAPRAIDFDADTSVGDKSYSFNYKLRPNAIKFDYIIANFPYVNTEGKSRLAIDGRFKMKSKNKGKQKIEDATLEVPNADGTSGGASFSWVPTVSVDDQRVDVTADLKDTSDDDEDSKKQVGEVNQKLVWTLTPAGNFTNIVWDPTFEAHTYGSGAMAVVPSLSVVAMGLAALFLGQ